MMSSEITPIVISAIIGGLSVFVIDRIKKDYLPYFIWMNF